jgi:hypothetical protein
MNKVMKQIVLLNRYEIIWVDGGKTAELRHNVGGTTRVVAEGTKKEMMAEAESRGLLPRQAPSARR